MSLQIIYLVTIAHAGDGDGQLSGPNGPMIRFQGVQNVPGLSLPSAAQITTALTAMATDINAQAVLNLPNLAQIQAFETGGN